MLQQTFMDEEDCVAEGQYLNHSILETELRALTTRLPHLLILASPETQIVIKRQKFYYLVNQTNVSPNC